MTMKRGIRWSGIVLSDPIPDPETVMGIPIFYVTDSKHAVADARGFGKWARIVVNKPVWSRLDASARLAVLYHEAGHIKARHKEIRLFLLVMLGLPSLVLLSWQVLFCLVLTVGVYFLLQKVAQHQETEADRFAAKNGFGPAMLSLVRAAGPPHIPPFFYPDFERRVGSLVRFLEESRK